MKLLALFLALNAATGSIKPVLTTCPNEYIGKELVVRNFCIKDEHPAECQEKFGPEIDEFVAECSGKSDAFSLRPESFSDLSKEELALGGLTFIKFLGLFFDN